METAEAEEALGAMSKATRIKQEKYNQMLFYISVSTWRCSNCSISAYTGGGEKNT